MFSCAKLYLFDIPAFVYAVLRQMICPFQRMCTFFNNSTRIADIGSGHGVFTLFCGITIPKAQIIGFEPNEKRVRIGMKAAEQLKNVTFICGTFHENEEVDAVCLSDVLHHIGEKDQEILISTIFNALPSGGKLLIKEICTNDGLKYCLSSLSDKLLYPKDTITFRSKHEWSRLLKQAGFSVICYHDRLSLLSTNLFFAVKK